MLTHPAKEDTEKIKPTLKLDWCSHEAATYAVKHWHYSRKMPKSKLAKIGVWENEKFIGSVVFGVGANNNIGTAFGLGQTQVCELTRVALREHLTPVSRIGSIAVKLLLSLCPGLRLIVSYADPKEGHHGGIYQAMGWIYGGISRPQRELLFAGGFLHKRVASLRWGTASPERIRAITGEKVEYGPIEWKHTYYLPLDNAMRLQLAPLAKPYPKRICERSADSGTVSFQEAGGGANPTCSLKLTD